LLVRPDVVQVPVGADPQASAPELEALDDDVLPSAVRDVSIYALTNCLLAWYGE
jgi:hypothetical protein